MQQDKNKASLWETLIVIIGILALATFLLAQEAAALPPAGVGPEFLQNESEPDYNNNSNEDSQLNFAGAQNPSAESFIGTNGLNLREGNVPNVPGALIQSETVVPEFSITTLAVAIIGAGLGLAFLRKQ